MDDAGTMSLNGHQIGVPEVDSVLDPGQFDNPPASQRAPFSIPAGSGFFLPGLNVLTVEVPQVDQFADGLRVTIDSATAESAAPAPEPGTIAIVAGGLLCLCGKLRGKESRSLFARAFTLTALLGAASLD